jgi:hypothetical protein
MIEIEGFLADRLLKQAPSEVREVGERLEGVILPPILTYPYGYEARMARKWLPISHRVMRRSLNLEIAGHLNVCLLKPLKS